MTHKPAASTDYFLTGMDRLKSRTGCVTCLTRKKKCDESKPTCGTCRRLGLACVPRTSFAARGQVTLTNMRGAPPSPRIVISSGFAPFESDLEKQLVLQSPRVLAPLVSRMADHTMFNNIVLLGTFAAQNTTVRSAIVAFSAYGRSSFPDESYKLCLKNYQRCVYDIREVVTRGSKREVVNDMILVALVFMGLLEALKLGDATHCLAHFEMCRRILGQRLAHGRPADQNLVVLYRIVAECTIFNLASMSAAAALSRSGLQLSDWGHTFDILYDHPSDSPFLGGLIYVYSIMLQINLLLREHSNGRLECRRASSLALDQDLNNLDRRIDTIYRGYPESAETTGMYRAKLKLTVLALKIHLYKICNPDASGTEDSIRKPFSQACKILREIDLREPGNIALRWPLTVLACAATNGEDFDLIVSKMDEWALILDPANNQRLRSAKRVLSRFYQRDAASGASLRRSEGHDEQPYARPIDFLLDPSLLETAMQHHDPWNSSMPGSYLHPVGDLALHATSSH